tara:strand:+ start:1142 stop:1939 length:798 start_codon:yes stop_codon:yes gene_type:complete
MKFFKTISITLTLIPSLSGHAFNDSFKRSIDIADVKEFRMEDCNISKRNEHKPIIFIFDGNMGYNAVTYAKAKYPRAKVTSDIRVSEVINQGGHFIKGSIRGFANTLNSQTNWFYFPFNDGKRGTAYKCLKKLQKQLDGGLDRINIFAFSNGVHMAMDLAKMMEKKFPKIDIGRFVGVDPIAYPARYALGLYSFERAENMNYVKSIYQRSDSGGSLFGIPLKGSPIKDADENIQVFNLGEGGHMRILVSHEVRNLLKEELSAIIN